MEDILGSVKRVADIVSEIAAASQEQSTGIDQVNAAVTQMDEMTQQNAALVEESSAAASALEDQAQELDRLMGFFKTGQLAQQPASTAHAPRKPVEQRPHVAAKAHDKAPAAKSHLAKLHDAGAKAHAKGNSNRDEDWTEF